MGVQKRRIPGLLTAVDMYPPFAVYAVDFRPDMVLGVPDPAHLAAHGSAEHREAIRPLSNSPSPCLQQDESVVVSRKPFERLTLGVRALVQLHSVRASCLLIGQRRRHAHRNRRRPACRALGIVDPFEKVPSEPLHERPHDTILVAPGGFGVRPERCGLGGKEIGLFLRFIVYPLQWHYGQRLVQQSRILPFARRVGQRHEHAAEAHRFVVVGRGGDGGHVLEGRVGGRRRHWRGGSVSRRRWLRSVRCIPRRQLRRRRVLVDDHVGGHARGAASLRGRASAQLVHALGGEGASELGGQVGGPGVGEGLLRGHGLAPDAPVVVGHGRRGGRRRRGSGVREGMWKGRVVVVVGDEGRRLGQASLAAPRRSLLRRLVRCLLAGRRLCLCSCAAGRQDAPSRCRGADGMGWPVCVAVVWEGERRGG